MFTLLIIYTSLGILKTIHFGNPKWRRSHYGGTYVDRDQQHHNFSKYTYEYYTKRRFSITLIVVLDAYKWKDIIVWLNSSANAFFLLAKFESPSWRWRMSRQNRPIKLKIWRSVVIFALFLRSIFLNFHFIRSQNDKKVSI